MINIGRTTLTLTLTRDETDVVVLDHIEVVDANIGMKHDWREIRSNPALFAALAGADPADVANLPGEQVAYHDDGTDLTITYQIRVRCPGTGLGEFRPVLPG